MVLEYKDWSLDEAIWNALDIWGDTREESWDAVEDREGRLARSIGETVASLVLEATESLSHSLLPENFTTILGRIAHAELVLEPVELAVATRLSTGVREKAKRCIALAALVVEEEPAEPLHRYLRRLSRCYIAGFDPEAVIICRAVLENALKDAFRRRDLPMPIDEKGRSTMAARIEAAARFKLLPPELTPTAKTIWKRGSKAAHEDPEVTKEVLGTIQMTMSVVSALAKN